MTSLLQESSGSRRGHAPDYNEILQGNQQRTELPAGPKRGPADIKSLLETVYADLIKLNGLLVRAITVTVRDVINLLLKPLNDNTIGP
jgi:hypothetical protein